MQPELRHLALDGESFGEQDAGRGRGGNSALALAALQRRARAAELSGRVGALFGLRRGPSDASLGRDLNDGVEMLWLARALSDERPKTQRQPHHSRHHPPRGQRPEPFGGWPSTAQNGCGFRRHGRR